MSFNFSGTTIGFDNIKAGEEGLEIGEKQVKESMTLNLHNSSLWIDTPLVNYWF